MPLPIGALIVSALAHTLRRFADIRTPAMRVFLAVEPMLESSLLLAAVLAVIMVRGHNDFGGLLDAALVAVVLGRVIGHTVVRPRAAVAGRDTAATAVLAAVVMVLAGAIGALVRLIETDNSANRALRLLLAALALDLTGIVLAGTWPPGRPGPPTAGCWWSDACDASSRRSGWRGVPTAAI